MKKKVRCWRELEISKKWSFFAWGSIGFAHLGGSDENVMEILNPSPLFFVIPRVCFAWNIQFVLQLNFPPKRFAKNSPRHWGWDLGLVGNKKTEKRFNVCTLTYLCCRRFRPRKGQILSVFISLKGMFYALTCPERPFFDGIPTRRAICLMANGDILGCCMNPFCGVNRKNDFPASKDICSRKECVV